LLNNIRIFDSGRDTIPKFEPVFLFMNEASRGNDELDISRQAQKV